MVDWTGMFGVASILLQFPASMFTTTGSSNDAKFRVNSMWSPSASTTFFTLHQPGMMSLTSLSTP